MILARIRDALKRQDPAAVAIEFVIVILGVVIGFQVTAWNAEREARQRELAYLDRIEVDLRNDIQAIDVSIIRFIEQSAAAQRVIAYHEADTPPDPVSYHRDFFVVLDHTPHRPKYASLDALQGAGDLNLLSNDQLISLLFEIEAAYADIEYVQDHIYEDLWAYLYETYADVGSFRAAIAMQSDAGNPPAPSLETYVQAQNNRRIENGLTLVSYNNDVLVQMLQDVREQALRALAEIEASR